MSDFAQTMKDWRRMCATMSEKDKYTACGRCKLRDFGCPAIYDADEKVDWAHVESVVAKWSEENPGPQYPSWAEYLTQIGAVNLVEQTQTYVHTSLFFKPIPENIAKKLGIKPKEG